MNDLKDCNDESRSRNGILKLDIRKYRRIAIRALFGMSSPSRNFKYGVDNIKSRTEMAEIPKEVNTAMIMKAGTSSLLSCVEPLLRIRRPNPDKKRKEKSVLVSITKVRKDRFSRPISAE
jgi:hypothetical protein